MMNVWYLFLVVAAVAVHNSRQDDCHTREIDLCAVTALLSLRDTLIPENDQEADIQCSYIKETMDCIYNFTNKCLTKLHKRLLSFILTGAIATIDEYCIPGSEIRKMVFKHSQCLTKAWYEQRSCIVDAQAGLEFLSEATADNRVNILCCTYRRYYECATETASRICDDSGIQNFIDDIVGRVALNIPRVICKSCKEEDKCNNIIPLSGTQPKGIKSKSPISQLLAMYLN